MIDSFEERFSLYLDSLLKINDGGKIGIAVSGGVDSMALLFLTLAYVKRESYLRDQTSISNSIVIFHVDHDLRPESGLEAGYVASIARQIGAKCFLMKWEKSPEMLLTDKISNLQEKARTARYDLIEEKSKEIGVEVLLTGHHFDDIIENYLYRKRRLAGIFGLSTNAKSYYKDLRILRPLSKFRKSELEKYLTAKGIKWCHDSSNDTDKYARNKIRKELLEFSLEEIRAISEEISAKNIEASNLHDIYLDCLSECCHIDKIGIAKIDLGKFVLFDVEVQIYVISYLLTLVSGNNKMPRYRVIEPLIGLLSKTSKGEDGTYSAQINRTVHDCQIFENKGNLIIYKEIAKVSVKSINLANNIIWDDRFQFCIKDSSEYTSDFISKHKISKLTESDLKCVLKSLEEGSTKENLAIKSRIIKEISGLEHKKILFTLPVIKNLEKVVAIPHIFFYDSLEFENNLTVFFRSNFISRFNHYLSN